MSDEELMIAEAEESRGDSKYLLCKLGEEEYGIDIAYVQSIEELQKIVLVPDMPDYVKGVINLRGGIIPVVDLRLKFGMEAREYDDRTCIVITRINETDIGLVVDTVSEVHDISDANIDPPPSFKGRGDQEQYISGLGKIGDEVKILLDVRNLIADEDLGQMDAAAIDLD